MDRGASSLIRWIDARSERAVDALLFALVFSFVAGLNTHGSFAGSGDEPHYAMIAHSLVFDGDLDLRNDYGDGRNLVAGGALTEPGLHATPGKDGRLRPVHDVGLPLLFAPWFKAAYALADHSGRWLSPTAMTSMRLNPPLILRHLISLAMIVVTGLLAVAVFRLCRRSGDGNTAPLLWTLLFISSPPVLSHSFLFFTEIPSALCVAILLLEFERAPSGPKRHALAGALLGTLLLLHVRNVGLVAGFLILFLVKLGKVHRRVAAVVWFGTPFFALVVARSMLMFVFWGTLFTSPHASAAGMMGVQSAAEQVAVRFFGLLVDSEHGLLGYAPVYLLVVAGFIVMRRAEPRRSRAFAALAAAYLLPILLPFTNRHGWDGGWSPAARFLVPITPMLIVAASRFPVHQRRALWAGAPSMVLQLFINVVCWSHPKLLWNDGDGTSRLAEFLSPAWLPLAEWLPSWHAPSTHSVVLSVAFVTTWLALSACVTRLGGGRLKGAAADPAQTTRGLLRK